MERKKYLECGKIINTHGIRGTVKIESLCNTPLELSKLKNVYLFENGNYVKNIVKKASLQKGFVLMDIESIDSIDKAESMREKYIYVNREDIKKGDNDFFIADLLGLPVKNIENGEILGKLVDVTNLGASDLYVVKTQNGEKMIPAVKEFIKKIDTDDGIYISLIEGLLD